MSLAVAVPLLGPPAVGKSTLAIRLGAAAGFAVFRLRAHVPATRLRAAGNSAVPLSWMDDATVDAAVDGYLDEVARAETVRCVVLDNFPGTSTQVGRLGNITVNGDTDISFALP